MKQISSGQQYVISKVLFVTASDLVSSYALYGISLELIFKSLEACVVREKEPSGNSKFSKLSGINMETCCFSGYNFNVTHSMHCKDIHPNILSVPPFICFLNINATSFPGKYSFSKGITKTEALFTAWFARIVQEQPWCLRPSWTTGITRKVLQTQYQPLPPLSSCSFVTSVGTLLTLCFLFLNRWALHCPVRENPPRAQRQDHWLW